MNTVMWILVGALLGWVAFSAMGLNEGRGMVASVIIGAVGGMLGGKLLAPLFMGPVAPEGVSMAALSIAAIAAAGCLYAGNMILDRWDV